MVIRNKEIGCVYSMLLGRPWLTDAMVQHDWANKLVTITGNGKVRTIPVNTRVGPLPPTPEVAVCYNYAEGLTDQQELSLFLTEEDLVPICTIDVNQELAKVREKVEARKFPQHFYETQSGTIKVNETPARLKVPGQNLSNWKISEDGAVRKINVGTDIDPKYLRMNARLEPKLAKAAEKVLREYSDVFAWSYTDLKRIPPELAEHKIELEPDVRPIRQT